MSKVTNDAWIDDRLTKEYLSLVCVYCCHTINEELGRVQIQPISSNGKALPRLEAKYHNHRYDKSAR
jgi:hypothetical protein